MCVCFKYTHENVHMFVSVYGVYVYVCWYGHVFICPGMYVMYK